jgi:ketosteroid isomerase-like protein
MAGSRQRNVDRTAVLVWVRQVDGTWKAAHRHDSVIPGGQPSNDLFVVDEECRRRKECLS